MEFGSLDGGEDWRDIEAQNNWRAVEQARAKEAAAKRTWGETAMDWVNAPYNLVKGLAQPMTKEPAVPMPQPINKEAGFWGSLNPFDETASMPRSNPVGNIVGNLAVGAADAIKSGATLPGDVLTGKVPMYENGQISPEIIKRAFDTASLAGGASVAGTAEKGAARAAALASDTGKPGAAVAAVEHAPAFYNTIEPALANTARQAGTGSQWANELKRYGAKPEEMDWRGASELFAQNANKPIPRADVESHLGGNKVELKPVEYTQPPKWEDLPAKRQYEIEDQWKGFGGRNSRFDDASDFYAQMVRDGDVPGAPRYSEYQLPGGENYRERVLTLPSKSEAGRQALRDEAARRGYGDRISEWPDKEFAQRYRNEVTSAGRDPSDYTHQHWPDVQNPIIHRRSTERDLGDGGTHYVVENINSGNKSQVFKSREEAEAFQNGLPKNIWTQVHEVPANPVRSLHAEEIQSDWHQAGAKKGYGSDRLKEGLRFVTAEDGKIHTYQKNVYGGTSDHLIGIHPNEEAALAAAKKAGLTVSGVPDAPFKDSWHRIALNDMLREAAEKGLDRISWTAGESQPTHPKNLGATSLTEEQMAKSDKGMKAFYDDKLVGTANKIGKAHGVSVKQMSIPDTGGMTGDQAMTRMGIPQAEHADFWENMIAQPNGYELKEKFMEDARKKGHSIHYMDVPQSLKDQALKKGFSLFEDTGAAAKPIAAIEHSPVLKEAFHAEMGPEAGAKAYDAYVAAHGGLGGEANVGPAVGAGSPGAGGGRGGLEEAQAAAARSAGAVKPLEGLPQPVSVINGEHYVPGPIESIHDVARQYMESTGRPYERADKFHPVDTEHAAAIARAFEKMKHDPENPKVKASYQAMIDETKAQYEALQKSGLKIEAIEPGMPDPYAANPRLAAKDVADNNHLWFFPTESGYGKAVGDAEAVKAIRDNPMLQKTGIKLGDRELLANDLFRVVHDYFGHLKEGHGFRAAGEDNAWRTHAKMYSDLARPAMTSETRGQNSWVNYGPHGESNRTASSADTVYADQKVGLLPDWVMKDRPKFVDAEGNAIKGAAYTKEARRILDDIAKGEKGAGPIDLKTQAMIPDVKQEGLPRYEPPRGISDRMRAALKNPDVVNGLAESMEKGRGVESWYHTEPVRLAFEKELGPVKGNAEFKRFMDIVAATSPRSDVPTNVRNASYYYSKGSPENLPPKNPYPYGHVAQKLHRQNFETVSSEGGWNPLQNPKPASFAENLRGNLEPVTVDTHAFRNIAMRTKDPRFLETAISQKYKPGVDRSADSLVQRYGEVKGDKVVFRPAKLFKEGKLTMEDAANIPSFWATKPKANEYAAAEKLFRDVGVKIGMKPADAQAAAWSGAGEMTGLGTVGTHTFGELLNERILFTARMRGESPKKVLSDMIRGKKPLLSDTKHGAAFGALDGGQQE